MSNPLRDVGKVECKAASTPFADKLELKKYQMPEDGSDEQQLMLRQDYRGLVGSLAYLSLSTRPDLAFRPTYCLDFLATMDLLTGKQRSTCYASSEAQLTFMKYDDTGLNWYTESDYASFEDDRRSNTGFCFNVGSEAISWAARRQTCVATSTTEAELHALSEAVK